MRRSVTRSDPGVNIQKTVETQWFRQENHLRLVGVPHLCQRLQEGHGGSSVTLSVRPVRVVQECTMPLTPRFKIKLLVQHSQLKKPKKPSQMLSFQVFTSISPSDTLPASSQVWRTKLLTQSFSMGAWWKLEWDEFHCHTCQNNPTTICVYIYV